MLAAELPDVALHASIDRYGDLGIHAVLDLRRRFSREELTRALAAAVEAFPVLGCRYEPGLWRDRWLPVSAPVSRAVHEVSVPVDVDAETERWARRPIDVRRERPLRLVSIERPEGTRLLFSISHVAADGGGIAAVGHVLGAHLAGVSPAFPVDRDRTVAGSLAGLRAWHLPVLLRDMAATAAFPLRTLGAARRERHFPAATAEPAAWRHLRIAPDDLARIKQRSGTSVNDALLAALARVAAGRSSQGPLAVMYTMDLRRYAGTPKLTAANTSSILTAFVPRSVTKDLATSARAVARITARQRGGLAGPAFVLAPLSLAFGAPHFVARRIVRWLHPLLIDLPLSRGLVFTNVGKVDDGLAAFGDDLESVAVIGPNVWGIRVPAVVAFGFRGALHLELFAPPGLAPEALTDLERELRAALEL